MSKFTHDSRLLAKVHSKANAAKANCHFVGFLEGVLASGKIERSELEPLVTECIQFMTSFNDCDASDIIQDVEAGLLDEFSLEDVVLFRVKVIDPQCEKSSLNRFLGFCRGVACDGVILTKEAEKIVETIDDNPTLQSVVGIKPIYVTCLDALNDGVVSPEESAEIFDLIGSVVGDCFADTGISQTHGVANFHEHLFIDLSDEIVGATIVLTGNFDTKPRRELEDRLAALGAEIAQNVSGKTNFLVIGGEASRDWIEMNRGLKMRKAQTLRQTSDAPLFVSESQLMRCIAGL